MTGSNYTFKYFKGTENGRPHGLYRLLSSTENVSEKDVEAGYFHFIVGENLPVTAQDIRKELRITNIVAHEY